MWKHTVSKHDMGTSHHITVDDGKMDADIIATMRYGNQEANATLIIEAVNHHAELVEALVAACGVLEVVYNHNLKHTKMETVLKKLNINDVKQPKL